MVTNCRDVELSFQKAQIQSSKALGDAQIQIAKLKNEDDKRLQENKFASDMLQDLLSDEPRHRMFAIIMLRRTFNASVYEELLSGIASSDPATDVRQAAIRQLGDSRNPNVAVALNRIATNPFRPKEERVLADGAKSNVAVIGTLSEGTCSFFAASSGIHAGRNAAQVAALLNRRGAHVMQMSGDQASRNGILSAASSFSAQCGDGMDCIVYFSGHGFSLRGRGYLLAYDSRLSGDAFQTMETCVSTQQLMQMLKQHVGKGSRLILFFDMDTSDAEGLSK